MKNLLRRVRLHAVPPLALSVSVSDVVDEFYDDFATMDSGRYWWWCQMILLDPNELIVNDGYDGLYRVSFSTENQGPGNPPVVSFGDPVPIRLEPVDTTVQEPDDAEYAAAKHEAVVAACAAISNVRGQAKVAASYNNRDESRPATRVKEEEQVREHIKRLRAKLSLGDDVSDEQVLAAAATRLEADPADPPADPDPATEPDDEPDPEVDDVPEPVTDPVKPQAKLVDAAALAQLQADAALGRKAYEANLSAENDRILDAAVDAGKFPPRMRSAYAKQLGNPALRAETIEFIGELDENVIPVKMRGQGDAGETVGAGANANGAHPQYDQYLATFMPDVAAKRAAALAGAAPVNQRVFTEA